MSNGIELIVAVQFYTSFRSSLSKYDRILSTKDSIKCLPNNVLNEIATNVKRYKTSIS